jgi:hypothetical protein
MRTSADVVQDNVSLYQLAIQPTGRRNSSVQLPNKVGLAKGMKVSVTNNIATDLGITNGTRGEIVDIVLSPNEPSLPADSIVPLQYLSLCIQTSTNTRISVC